jgi:hypothetical protein
VGEDTLQEARKGDENRAEHADPRICFDQIAANPEIGSLFSVALKLREQTEKAQRRGIFGGPSFFVGDEMVWATTAWTTRWNTRYRCASDESKRH